HGRGVHHRSPCRRVRADRTRRGHRCHCRHQAVPGGRLRRWGGPHHHLHMPPWRRLQQRKPLRLWVCCGRSVSARLLRHLPGPVLYMPPLRPGRHPGHHLCRCWHCLVDHCILHRHQEQQRQRPARRWVATDHGGPHVDRGGGVCRPLHLQRHTPLPARL
ncbi:hypothetical protein APUTEX25_001079, partial [Auxenochlorella protothecoides]